MHRKSRTRKSVRDQKFDDIPMTPMIDVVFQLLIYFVFTFEIPDRMSQMPVFRPAPDMRGTPPEQEIRSMRIGVYDGFYTLNDTRVTEDSLSRTFNRLANLDPNQNMIVIATGNSRHRFLVNVLDLLQKAGLERVTLLSAD
jgi:biopolymer transport protein ExbD